jgi:tetratricopeptide (TPR) repeat protein
MTDPYSEYWKNRGDDFFLKGDFEEAIKCYVEAVNINPDYSIAWNNMGYSYSKLGRKEDTKKCKEKIIEIKKREKIFQNNKPDFFSSLKNAIFGEEIKESALYKPIINESYPKGSINGTIEQDIFTISVTRNFPGQRSDTNEVPEGLLAIGTTNPICPYCRMDLGIMPKRKKKCKSCGKFIFVRTRPLDNCKILIKEDEIELIEEQWAIKQGFHEEYKSRKTIKKQEYDEAKADLTKAFGETPSENDIQWRLLNDNIRKSVQNNDWGLYRQTIFEQGEFIRKEKKLKYAMGLYFSVCYLDLNGIIYWKWGIFNRSESLAPGIIERIIKIKEKLQLSKEETYKIYMDFAKIESECRNLLVSPEDAWEIIQKEIF